MAIRIFKDEQMQALFDKQGFLTVPFIDTNEVKQLNDLFDELHPSLPQQGFVSGSYSPDIEYKKKASNAIVEVLRKQYERLFINYQAFGAAFLFKMPSQNSELGIHQDWTIVDENKFVALNCWIPLTDINETNGALHVVPGSHYPSYKTLRAPTVPFFFSGSEDVVIAEAIPMYVKAGEAVILNQSVIHYSPPNRSDKIRKAITAGVKSEGAPMHFHYKTRVEEDKQLEVFEMPEDFLISFDDFYKDIFERPKLGHSIGHINYASPVLARAEVASLISNMKARAGFEKKKVRAEAEQPKGFFRRLVEVFQ
jgi:ectoine hydroxylase-related dioxygenase (phytanoyl-CoA dioxygenase family)